MAIAKVESEPEHTYDSHNANHNQEVTSHAKARLVEASYAPPSSIVEGSINEAHSSDSDSDLERRMSSLSVGKMGGVTYSWHNLNVYADTQNFFGKVTSTAHILKDVSGICKGGHLLAIMGASGAGKTTLLNVLTFRSINLKVNGDIRVNGHLADPDTLMGISAYVQQLDLFTRVFTVREQLEFHAQLRIGKTVTPQERKTRIDEVIRELGMTKCANTLIGEPGRIKGISGGEKKRLAFACELITNPLLLLCDEPTSGLDSFMAESVMKAMKKMTHLGKTVISTIHQPNSEVFSMFDRLLILAEGRVAFLGNVDEAHKFFTRIERPCPSNFNPGDHFIFTLAVKGGEEEECRAYVNKVCDDFRNNEGVALLRMIEEAKKPPSSDDPLSNLYIPKSPYRSTWVNQFAALFRRSYLEMAREPIVPSIKAIQAMFFSLVFGLIYLNQDPNTVTGIQNITAVLFIFVTNLSFSTLFAVITVFAEEMPLFLREHWNGLYRSDTYFLTRNLIELPIQIFVPVAFISVNYYMVGLRPEAEHFFIAMGILILVGNVSVSYGYLISCLSNDFNEAVVLATPLTFPLMIFGGFYVQAESLPVYIGWMKYLSFFMYGFEGMSINQWDGYEYYPPGSPVPIPIGEKALDKLAFDPEHFGMDIWGLVVLLVGYRIIGYLFLYIKTLKKRN